MVHQIRSDKRRKMARLTLVLFVMVVLVASAVDAEGREKRLIIDKIKDRLAGKVSFSAFN